MWQAWINFLVGLYLFISSFSMSFINPWNFLIAGIIVAVFGFWARGTWQGVVNGIIGLWLVLSSFVPGLVTRGNMWIAGLLVAIFAIWRIYDTRRRLTAE
jgi:hypothetical protein